MRWEIQDCSAELAIGVLKPCPFCGGSASIHRWVFRDGFYFENCAQVRCDSITCGAKSYEVCECMAWDEVDRLAIAAWNRRAKE